MEEKIHLEYAPRLSTLLHHTALLLFVLHVNYWRATLHALMLWESAALMLIT